MVRDKAVLRGLIQTATTIVSDSYEDTEDVDTLLDRAEQSIFEISQRKSTAGFANINTILKDSFKHIEQLYERKELITGLSTGFTDFDRLTAGLQPADLIVIAGRPSMGKTALSLNIAQHVGVHVGRPVAIFSLEMAKEQLVMRMLCAEARVNSASLRTGFLSREDWPRLTKAAGTLSEARIYIDDSPAQTSLDIRAKARRLRAIRRVGADHCRLFTAHARTRTYGEPSARNFRDYPIVEGVGERTECSGSSAISA
jgi:replicative DNA helicase